MVAIAALTLAVGLGIWRPHDAMAAPGDDTRLPGIEELAVQLGLTPEEVEGFLEVWAPTLGERAVLQRGGTADETLSLLSQESAPIFLPLALHGSGPLTPPRWPTASRTPAVTPVASPTPTEPVDPATAMFDPDALLDVRIEMDPADWDALRVQARTLAEIFSHDECMTEPNVSPFTYFRADLLLDGVLMTDVGVRKKGLLGSMSSTKPSLKIRFDKYVDRGRYGGLSRLTLNNAKQDPSFVRQCVTYGLFAKAGLPAPRCSYARVTVNGHDLGIYVHVESVKKPFLERAFGDDSGNLYEGTLSDFTSDWVGTFERKTNKTDPDRADLEALVAALAADDEELLDALEPVLDVDAFLSFWALEVLTGHWDGYTSNRNNFYLYRDPNDDRITFIPWGSDGAFNLSPRRMPDGSPAPDSVTATSHLARRLYMHPEGSELYFTRLEQLLDEVWDEELIAADIDRAVELIEPELNAGAKQDLRSAAAFVRSFARSRRPAIEAELRGGRPALDFPPSGPPCRNAFGHFQGSFAVRWDQPGVITATASVQLAGVQVELVQAGAAAGLSEDDPWPTHAAIQVAGLVAQDAPPVWRGGDIFTVILFVDPARFGADSVLDVDGHNAFGWAVLHRQQVDGTRQVAAMGMPWVGTVKLDEAGTEPGDVVSGVVDFDIVSWGGL